MAGMKFARSALNTEIQLVDGQAPEWVELIPSADATGMVVGRDGRRWRWDAAAAAAVLAAFRERGLDLPVDWEHATQHLAPQGKRAPASGWIDQLDVRDGALWGHVSWTPAGADDVLTRGYRYMSPVFDYEEGSLRIARMVTVALTNTPNLRLQALNSEEETAMNRSAALTAAITAALGLAADAADDAVAQAINTLKTDRDTARALNSESTPSLERYVPRADYDAVQVRATNAEQALKERAATEHQAAVDTAIQGALQAGKISPATEQYHRASCSDQEGLERFRQFVAVAPEIAGDAGLGGRKPAGQGTALNAEEIAAKARVYQTEQKAAGNEISIAAAVRHVTKEA